MMTFHLDVRHFETSPDLQLVIGDRVYDLRAHDPESLHQARQSHAVLRNMAAGAVQRFSHFADVPKVDLPSDTTELVRVMTPAAPGMHLGQTVAMAHFIPQAALQAHFETSLHRHARAKLHGLGRAEGRKARWSRVDCTGWA